MFARRGANRQNKPAGPAFPESTDGSEVEGLNVDSRPVLPP